MKKTLATTACFVVLAAHAGYGNMGNAEGDGGGAGSWSSIFWAFAGIALAYFTLNFFMKRADNEAQGGLWFFGAIFIFLVIIGMFS